MLYYSHILFYNWYLLLLNLLLETFDICYSKLSKLIIKWSCFYIKYKYKLVFHVGIHSYHNLLYRFSKMIQICGMFVSMNLQNKSLMLGLHICIVCCIIIFVTNKITVLFIENCINEWVSFYLLFSILPQHLYVVNWTVSSIMSSMKVLHSMLETRQSLGKFEACFSNNECHSLGSTSF